MAGHCSPFLTILDHCSPFPRPVPGGETFSPPASALGPQQKNWLCHPLPLTVQRGQHNTKYVTFELLLHAAFMAFMPDTISGDKA